MKAYSFKIPKKPQENIILQEDIGNEFYNRLHYHEEIQISHIIKGEGKLIVGNGIHNYKEGDTVAIGSNIPHLFKSKKNDYKSQMTSIFFSKNAFGENFFDLPEMQQTKTFFEKIKYGISYEIKSLNNKNPFLDLEKIDSFNLFIKLLDMIKGISEIPVTPLNNQLYQKEISKQHGKRLQLVYNYVVSNFQKEIKLHKIAELAHMSPNAFCRFFKQRSNKTFFTFLTEVRIAHACHMLLANEDTTIAQIAYSSGFNSISNFNKHFKSIKGSSPTKYQKQDINLKNLN